MSSTDNAARLPKLSDGPMYRIQNIIIEHITIDGDELFNLAQAILTHIDTVCREAYKKGYTDKGIEELTK